LNNIESDNSLTSTGAILFTGYLRVPDQSDD
jgi:hypothetical protein